MPSKTIAELLGPERLELFWSHITKSESGCWEWTPRRKHGTYGTFRLQGKSVGSHRLSYALHHNLQTLPAAVLHTCDNPPCCRPDHLYDGDAKSNADDVIRRRRHPAQKPDRAKNTNPVWWHPSGQWTKKHKGRNYYFGSGSLDDALRRYLVEWPDILSGRSRVAAAAPGPMTVRDLVNQFLTHKNCQVESGEMSHDVWRLYDNMAVRVLNTVGKTRPVASLDPTDYGRIRAAAATDMAPTTLTTFLKLARAMFAFGAELTQEQPRYGGQFNFPPQRVIRMHRESRPKRLVEAADLRKLLKAADVVTKAQILLGLNAAFGSTDISDLTGPAFDQRPGWVILARKKTGTPRRCPLWGETAAAVAAAREARPHPAEPAHADRLFLSPHGHLCKRYRPPVGETIGTSGDAVGAAWKKLCRKVGVSSPGSFYVLRHVFRTVADELPDRVAIDLIMGHADDSMASHYRERVDDARLVAVTDHVRAWLWPPKGAKRGNRRPHRAS
jgi:integrase